MQSRFYRAPELILENDLNDTCDFYSLGVVLYEIMTSEPLFVSDVDSDQMY